MGENGRVCETAGAAVVLGTSFFPLYGGFSNVFTKNDYPFWIQGMFLTYFLWGKCKFKCAKNQMTLSKLLKKHTFCARINKIFGGDQFLKEASLKYFPLGLAFSRDGFVHES